MTAFVFSQPWLKFYLLGELTVASTSAVISQSDSTKLAQPTGSEKLRCQLSDDTENLELVDITANPHTGVLTIERGVESTAAREWPTGAALVPVITAQILTELEALK